MDPHLPEYLAAVGGLHEQTPSRRALDGHAVGDHISFRLQGWPNNSYDDGRVVDFSEERNRLFVETVADVVEVDPRPWPVGEVLPF
jgi:hypothetical protein